MSTPSSPAPSPVPGESVISVRRALIGYDGRPTINDVDFGLAAGEVVALVGPNGSGKTTLLRGILGLAPLLGGEIDLFGVPAARFKDRYRIGYVPQRHTVGGAIPATVAEVVSSGRLPHKRWPWPNADDRAAVADALEMVGLDDRRSAPVATLSGGQQRRTLIARALAGRPDVLVMDEPTAGVDAENQANLVRTLARLVGHGLTLLVVTHEVGPLLPILTRVVTLEAGRITLDADAKDAAARGLFSPFHDAGHDLAHTAPVPDGTAADGLVTGALDTRFQRRQGH